VTTAELGRQLATLFAVASVVVGLSGCTPRGLDVFSRVQVESDTLPAVAREFPGVESETTRLVWTDGDWEYFAALRPGQPQAWCLLVRGQGDVIGTCADAFPVFLTRDGVEVALGDEAPGPEWVEETENLWVNQPR